MKVDQLITVTVSDPNTGSATPLGKPNGRAKEPMNSQKEATDFLFLGVVWFFKLLLLLLLLL